MRIGATHYKYAPQGKTDETGSISNPNVPDSQTVTKRKVISQQIS
jgi:hypothetical protein